MSKFVAAIDQGTTSTRCMIFNHAGEPIGSHQLEHTQIFPQPGWVEHDALEIWEKTEATIKGALASANITAADLEAIGITNQRETTLVWNRKTGQPVYNAIVWQDTRTAALVKEMGGSEGQDRFRETVGLPLATYFSGPKIRWILDNVEGAREQADAGEIVFGTMDSWLIWNLTGGVNGGVHVTDVTNASRTMLMDLKTLSWSEEIAGIMQVPLGMLPEIKSSSMVYGHSTEDGPFGGVVPVAGALGDQHAATVGQACFDAGEAKNTYGTGCFMILNTGEELVQSKNGLLTTVCYKFGDEPTVYALEGSIAVTGSLIQWLRDNLKIIDSAPEVEALAASVDDNGGIYFVPAFSGLFAPYWRSDARGAIVGMTAYVTNAHVARAALEATAYQTREVLDAMVADSGVELKLLKVDGGMVRNELLMQFQADVLGEAVIRPKVIETTALGAAYAAGYATGFWSSLQEMRDNWGADHTFEPDTASNAPTELYAQWKKAVTRTFDWEN